MLNIILIIFIIFLTGVIYKKNIENFYLYDKQYNNLDKVRYSKKSDEYIYPKIFKNLLTKEEIKYIIEYSKIRLRTSSVVGYENKSYDEITKLRKSRQTWIPKHDDVIKSIMKRVSKIVNKPIDNFEELQVVHYNPNNFYKQHHDACCTKDKACKEFVNRGGQRLYTMLIYLNDKFTGGETHFPELNKKIKLRPGDGILFNTLDKDQKGCHPKALHAGLPVKSGEKWICNIWVRENKFT